MVESMVERVARAIEGEIDIVEMVSASPEAIRRLRATRIARAAIEAMREPTDAMVDTAWAEIGEHGDADVAVIYANMIDAALNEQVAE